MNSSFFVLIILSSLSTGLAFADLEDDIDALLKKGMTSLQQENFEKAISFFDKVLAIDPNNTDALFNKGSALVQLDKPEEAISYFDKVLAIDPNNANALSYKGDRLAKIGKSDEAISYFKQVLKIEPNYHDVMGISISDRVLAIDPSNIDALNLKGDSLVSLGRSESGITVVYVEKLDEAISYFDKVLAIDPNNTDALFNKGRALVQLNKTGEGISYVDKVLAIDPNNANALSYKGDRLITEDKLEEGMVYIDKSLAIDPNNADALFNKGFVAAKQKHFDEAVSYYDKVLKINPGYSLAAKNLEYSVKFLGLKNVDGFLDVTVHDSNGYLVAHLRIPRLQVVNHTIGNDFIDTWSVIKTITNNGQPFEVLQYKVEKDVHGPNIYGGATQYAIRYPNTDNVFKVYANYWLYQVEKGDKVTFVYTIFRPAA